MKRKLLGLTVAMLLAAPLMQAKYLNTWYYLTNKTGKDIKVYTADDPMHTSQAGAFLLINNETKAFFKDHKAKGMLKGPIRFFYVSTETPDGKAITSPGEKFYEYSGARYTSPQQGRFGIWTNKVSGTLILGSETDSDGDRIPILAQTFPQQNTRGKFNHPRVAFKPYRAPAAAINATKVQEVKNKDF